VIPTAPAILNAIHDAIAVRIRKVPATPDRIRAAILAAHEILRTVLGGGSRSFLWRQIQADIYRREVVSLREAEGSAFGAALLLAAALAVPLGSGQNSADPAPRRTVIDPRAQALLDKTIQALGGASYLAFKRLTTSGRAFSFSDGQTAGLAPFESVVEYPDKRRFSYATA